MSPSAWFSTTSPLAADTHISAPTSKDRTCARPISTGLTDRARKSAARPQTSHFISAGGQCPPIASNRSDGEEPVVQLVVINHVTLDGVMQAPGRPDEDPRGDFRHGGWAVAGSDELTYTATGKWMARRNRGLLLGRRTYEGILASWNERGGPFKESLNAAPKYVVSSS